MSIRNGGFISVPFTFAGKEPMRLTIFASHLLQRSKERLGIEFGDAYECAKYLANLLRDPRLETISRRVPFGAGIALRIKPQDIVIYFRLGTRRGETELKVSTICKVKEGVRALVNKDDYCYLLPEANEGGLRFGRNKHYFEVKQREENALYTKK